MHRVQCGRSTGMKVNGRLRVNGQSNCGGPHIFGLFGPSIIIRWDRLRKLKQQFAVKFEQRPSNLTQIENNASKVGKGRWPWTYSEKDFPSSRPICFRWDMII